MQKHTFNKQKKKDNLTRTFQDFNYAFLKQTINYEEMMSCLATVLMDVAVSRQLYGNNIICRHVSFSDFASGVSLLLQE